MTKCGLCPIDKKPKDSISKRFGVPACQDCIDKINTVRRQPQAVGRDKRTEAQKEDGAKHFNSVLQPRRQGEASLEFINTYPEEAKKIFTKQEILKSKPTWYDQKGSTISKDNTDINPKALE